MAWAALLLLHPTGDGDEFFPVVADETTAWIVVHVGTMLFIPLLAAVVYLLLRGVEGGAARVARVALVAFVLFYTAWEVLVGIGLGLFVAEVDAGAAGDRAAGRELVEAYADAGLIRALELVGTGSLFVALTAAGIALRAAGAPLAVTVLLVLAAVPIAWHVTPFGQLGLGLLVIAIVLVVRSGAPRRAPAPGGARPTPA